MKLEEETYLGDGLYVSYDGFMIKLRAPRISGDHWIGLEPDVLVKFEKYVAALRSEIARIRAGPEQ